MTQILHYGILHVKCLYDIQYPKGTATIYLHASQVSNYSAYKNVVKQRNEESTSVSFS